MEVVVKQELKAGGLAEFLAAVEHTRQAMLNLQIKWEKFDGLNDVLCDGYPFDKSFEEYVYGMEEWVERLTAHHDKMRLAEFEAWKVAQ
jgi:hypothetical protein